MLRTATLWPSPTRADIVRTCPFTWIADPSPSVCAATATLSSGRRCTATFESDLAGMDYPRASKLDSSHDTASQLDKQTALEALSNCFDLRAMPVRHLPHMQ